MLKITSISHFFPLSLLFRLGKSLPRSEHFSFIPLIVNVLFQFLYHAYSSLLFLILLTPLITHTLSFPSYTSPFLPLLSTPPSTFTPSLNPLLFTPRLSPLIPPIILSCLHPPPLFNSEHIPFLPTPVNALLHLYSLSQPPPVYASPLSPNPSLNPFLSTLPPLSFNSELSFTQKNGFHP